MSSRNASFPCNTRLAPASSYKKSSVTYVIICSGSPPGVHHPARYALISPSISLAVIIFVAFTDFSVAMTKDPFSTCLVDSVFWLTPQEYRPDGFLLPLMSLARYSVYSHDTNPDDHVSSS